MKTHKLKSQFKGWLGALFCTLLLITPFQSIFTHGTVTFPPSRVWICFQEGPEDPDSPACIDAIAMYGTQALYDWNEVARMDANGAHREIIADGNLASAGRPDKYGGLDQIRNDWVATPVTPGPLTVTWTHTAPHQTLYFDVYITKADWTPDQPLTWDSLELLVRTQPRDASSEDNIDVTLPNRTGKHVIYSVWQRSLSEEAFYSTSDVDFGSEPIPNRPPVAAFTSDNGRCGGPDVTFSAADSSDPNNDSLTYTWDFGDGTTAEGIEVSHSFDAALDDATVTLTVSDGEFSSGIVETIDLSVVVDCRKPVCPFDTPRTAALPSINSSYENIYVFGGGAPNLDNIASLSINWDLGNNGLYQFSMNTTNGIPNWYNDLSSGSTQNFNSAEPQITISGSDITGLDGSYHVTLDGDNFVLVSIEEGFTIYFSNSTTAPNCDGTGNPSPPVVDGGVITGGPFTFTVGDGIVDNVSGISVSGSSGSNATWVVTDDQLEILGLPPTIAALEGVNFDVAGVGTCLIWYLRYEDGLQGAAVGNNAADLQGTFDLSNSITVTRNQAGGPIGGDCTFDAPLSTSLVNINTSYENVYVLGTGGPNMDNVTMFTLNWDLSNNGLYQFSFNLNTAPWYIDFSDATQSFNESNPEISLVNTGITGLDGDYYATIDERNFVLVSTTGDFTIYFSNSATAPDCDQAVKENENLSSSFTMFPNPAASNVSISNKTDLQNSTIIISDLTGKQVKSLSVSERTNRVTIDISGLETGLYLVRVLDRSGSNYSLKLLVD